MFEQWYHARRINYLLLIIMLRVVLFILAAALVYILFFADLKKRTRLVTGAALFLSTVVVLWALSQQGKPRENLIDVSQIEVCDVDVQYSYRTNYAVKLCLKNNHESATVRRVSFTLNALDCSAGETSCRELASTTKSRPLQIMAGQEVLIEDSMSFDALGEPANSTEQQITWRASVDEVLASK